MSGHESSKRTPTDLAPPPRGVAPGEFKRDEVMGPGEILNLIETTIERGGPESAYAVSGKLIRALRVVIDIHEPYVPPNATTLRGVPLRPVPDLRPICQACEGELWPCRELQHIVEELSR